MRHQRDLFRSLAAMHSELRAIAQQPAMAVRERVLRLTLQILVSAFALRTNLDHEAVADVRDIEPEIERVIEAAEGLMNRLAS